MAWPQKGVICSVINHIPFPSQANNEALIRQTVD
jgi:hypothetical protein